MNFGAFFSYVFLSSITPGPNNIMSMSLASSYGLKPALRYCLGVGVGIALIAAVMAVFSSLLYSYLENIELIMKIIGAAYILYLAFLIVRDKPHEQKKENKTHLRPDSMFTGAIMQFINPKGILFCMVCMSTFILPHYQSLLEIGIFTLILGAFGVFSSSCWAFFGSVFQKLFSRYRKVINIILALLLVYCAVSLFL